MNRFFAEKNHDSRRWLKRTVALLEPAQTAFFPTVNPFLHSRRSGEESLGLGCGEVSDSSIDFFLGPTFSCSCSYAARGRTTRATEQPAKPLSLARKLAREVTLGNHLHLTGEIVGGLWMREKDFVNRCLIKMSYSVSDREVLLRKRITDRLQSLPRHRVDRHRRSPTRCNPRRRSAEATGFYS